MLKDVMDSSLKIRSEAIYPTATPDMLYQLYGSTNPTPILRALGIESDDHKTLFGR